jgi:hypothetical protein
VSVRSVSATTSLSVRLAPIAQEYKVMRLGDWEGYLVTLDEPSNNEDEIEDVNEDGVDEDVVYSVNSFGADFLVDGLINRLKSEDIYRPSFQRNFVWTIPQASKFIESILLGLPIPGIFLYREHETRKHLIIDGLQRLTTIDSFARGRFSGGGRVFNWRS